ncbi:MAG TPA: diacylglycerol kinase family protein [Actinomycetes bacterium]|nr:diacylglycerol kinase family protein [Actinomycetes bacterium]
MTMEGDAGGSTRRGWAVLALAALLLLLVGLVRVVVGSGETLLHLLVGTVLSLGIMAAAAWWAFTTRRVWKRWMNLAIAGLAVANVVLGLVELSVGQTVAALAIVAGVLGYAAAARRALRPAGLWPAAGPPPAGLWTAAGPPPTGPLDSPSGGPSGHGQGSHAPSPSGGPSGQGQGSHAPSRPWLLVNPRSGGGKAERFGLVGAAEARGVRVHVLAAGDDPAALARQAVATGADALGVAGGDGSLGLVAAVAVEADVPFVCVPAGTRNHFAGDLGLDRANPLAALDAFAGPERRVDVGVVGDRVFVNNVSLGAYADLVADPRYRAGKLATAHAVLPASLRGERALLQLDLRDAEGGLHSDVLVLLVASNRYELNGVRERLDGGELQVSALRARTGAALAGLATRIAARGGRVPRTAGWAQWTTTSLRVEATLTPLPAGIDGEAATLEPPLEFRLLPKALRVLLPPALRPAAGRLRLQSWSTIRRLLAIAAGRRTDP